VPSDPNAAPLALAYANSLGASTWASVGGRGSTVDSVVDSTPLLDGRLLLVAGVPARLVIFDPTSQSLTEPGAYPLSPDTSGIASVDDAIVIASLELDGVTRISTLPTPKDAAQS
jgi:hypothetical protein